MLTRITPCLACAMLLLLGCEEKPQEQTTGVPASYFTTARPADVKDLLEVFMLALQEGAPATTPIWSWTGASQASPSFLFVLLLLLLDRNERWCSNH